MSTQSGEGVSLLRLNTVKARTGLSRSGVYRAISDGTFPAPIHIAGTRVALWPSNDVDTWIASAVEMARGA